MADTARAPRALRRWARLLVGPSALRRPCDRLEGIVIVLLWAAFLAAIAAAPALAGRLYQSQQAAAGRLHPATAVLTENGPGLDYTSSLGEAAARWTTPGGQRRSGTLTTLTAPGISGAAAGARVSVWLSSSGQPQPPPPGDAGLFADAVIAFGAVVTAGGMLLISYYLCRRAIDRRRLAAWTADWSLTGPRWTTRL